MKDNIIIKEKFKERYEELTDFETFKKFSLSYLRRSIRVNTLKIGIPPLQRKLEDNWNLEQIPWCKEGFWIEHHKKERRDVGNIPEHVFGYFYTQEAASMIPPLVLGPKPSEHVLDLCAAPGSKSTQIAALMENRGILIVNDFKGSRISPLGINMQRMGVTNHIITQMEGRFFKGFQFDRVLVDAPCSGTGTIRKSFKTLLMWNPDMVKRLSAQQKILIQTAFENLKLGGTMVYSTCSLEPEENEEIIDFLLAKNQNAHIEKIHLPLQRSDPIEQFEKKQYDSRVKDCLRIWPQDNDTEGFFVAKIKKIA